MRSASICSNENCLVSQPGMSCAAAGAALAASTSADEQGADNGTRHHEARGRATGSPELRGEYQKAFRRTVRRRRASSRARAGPTRKIEPATSDARAPANARVDGAHRRPPRCRPAPRDSARRDRARRGRRPAIARSDATVGRDERARRPAQRPQMASTSLSCITARTQRQRRRPPRRAGSRPAPAAPAGLCAASMQHVAIRLPVRSHSSRAGQSTSARRGDDVGRPGGEAALAADLEHADGDDRVADLMPAVEAQRDRRIRGHRRAQRHASRGRGRARRRRPGPARRRPAARRAHAAARDDRVRGRRQVADDDRDRRLDDAGLLDGDGRQRVPRCCSWSSAIEVIAVTTGVMTLVASKRPPSPTSIDRDVHAGAAEHLERDRGGHLEERRRRRQRAARRAGDRRPSSTSAASVSKRVRRRPAAPSMAKRSSMRSRCGDV